ncbi:MAG: 16S rRNA (guanine(966)-N(2))-methyltransferase RsmD [Candidatus Omnitrophica bacterium]|nr:16S rRNA (guanine(966)-N(2))-methyltransferase RsmD [Candidatus Omnitrophota bacterium]
MRIIAGKFKSRSIEMPKGIKPTSDKVREALFEILKGRIEGAFFLDLYCGSGAMGVEAFSRGARSVTFVDKSPGSIGVLKKNLKELGILGLSSIDIYTKDAVRALETFKAKSMLFDLVFMDPPYYKDLAKNTLIGISNYDILARNAIIVAEVYKKEELPLEAGAMKKFRTARYGDTKLEFYKNEKDSGIPRQL